MTVQATFAATLVDEWVRGGVTDAVVCPGSRSTPLALALAADGRLRLHVHHDERSAGFTALGLGLAHGRPAVVLTTSGTAAVELHPAVVEASMAGVPMIACTADRPPELQDVGAPQTIDQTHLFGRAARWYAAPGVADEAWRPTWRSLAARSVIEATGPWPGPVHLNLAFRDPLVGHADELPPGRDGGAPWERGAPRAGSGSVVDPGLTTTLARARGLLIAGGGIDVPEGVFELAETAGWPVLADPRSGCRVPGELTVAAFDAILRHDAFAAEHRPEVVIRLGSPSASKVLGQWLASAGGLQLAVAGPGRRYDPDHDADIVVAAEPGAWCSSLAAELAGLDVDAGWASGWRTAEAAAQAAVDRVLGRRPAISEPAVARHLAAELPDGATLVVGSSMPVRDVEWFSAPRSGLRVLANRGANGIDGVVSTAVGVALACDGAPTAALVGDLSFLHDASALLALADRRVDLTIVVVDNRGGGIFSFLPQAAAIPPDRFELLFGTPHDVDLLALARVHGLAVRGVRTAADLDDALGSVGELGVRVVVARTDRASNVAVHDELHAEVARVL
ncbi:MAG TPA: 2-succinyl-5-enolpyruvyl-6-hydroxy-3-cyclohexene-1-carboxylic-acid synthase [Acidimicrobiales bacterium]